MYIHGDPSIGSKTLAPMLSAFGSPAHDVLLSDLGFATRSAVDVEERRAIDGAGVCPVVLRFGWLREFFWFAAEGFRGPKQRDLKRRDLSGFRWPKLQD